MATKTKKVQVVGISADDLGVVSYDVAQDLTDEQKKQARENIGSINADWSVNDETSAAFVKNRPFYGDETVITWDGTTDTALDGVIAVGPSFYLVKVSEETPTLEDLKANGVIRSMDIPDAGENITMITDDITTVDDNGRIEVSDKHGNYILVSVLYEEWEPPTMPGTVVPKGTYFMASDSGQYTMELSCGDLKTIDYKYMPEGYPTAEYRYQTLVDNISVVTDGNVLDNPFEIKLVENLEYNVVLDDTTYTCKAYYLEGANVIGNSALAGMGDDTGEPFCLATFGDDVMLFMDADAAGEHTISVVERSEIITTIDEKFVPEISHIHNWYDIGIERGKTLVPKQTFNATSRFTVYGEEMVMEDGYFGAKIIDNGDYYWTETADGFVVVVFDGKTYTNIPYVGTGYGGYIGNPAMMGTGMGFDDRDIETGYDVFNNLPFCVWDTPMPTIIYTTEGEHTIEIFCIKSFDSIKQELLPTALRFGEQPSQTKIDYCVEKNFRSGNEAVLTISGIEYPEEQEVCFAYCGDFTDLSTYGFGVYRDGSCVFRNGLGEEIATLNGTELSLTAISGQDWEGKLYLLSKETTIVPIDPKYLPLEAQSDWAENNENSVSYVKNRTHYEVEPDSLVTLVSDPEDDTNTMVLITGLNVNNKYTVVIGENRFENIKVVYNDNKGLAPNSVEIGNFDLYPFYLNNVANLGEDGSILNNNLDETQPLYFEYNEEQYPNFDYSMLRIYNTNDVFVKQLDSKYIPTPTDDEMLNALIEADMLMAVTDTDGAILTDENGNIIMW